MRVVRGNVAARIKSNAEVDEELALFRSGESHCQQHQIRLELELGPGDRDKVGATVRQDLSLEANAVDALHPAVLTRERGRGDAPVPLSAFLMRVTRAQL